MGSVKDEVLDDEEQEVDEEVEEEHDEAGDGGGEGVLAEASNPSLIRSSSSTTSVFSPSSTPSLSLERRASSLSRCSAEDVEALIDSQRDRLERALGRLGVVELDPGVLGAVDFDLDLDGLPLGRLANLMANHCFFYLSLSLFGHHRRSGSTRI